MTRHTASGSNDDAGSDVVAGNNLLKIIARETLNALGGALGRGAERAALEGGGLQVVVDNIFGGLLAVQLRQNRLALGLKLRG